MVFGTRDLKCWVLGPSGVFTSVQDPGSQMFNMHTEPVMSNLKDYRSVPDSTKVQNGSRMIHAGFPSFGWFGVGGLSYSNLLESTVYCMLSCYARILQAQFLRGQKRP